MKKYLPLFWYKLKLLITKKKTKEDTSLKVIDSSKINIILRKITNIIKESFFVTISAQIMILPVMIINFNTVSFTFIFSNILASFLIGPITIGGFLLLLISFISIQIAAKLSIIIKIFLEMLLLISKIGAKLPLSKVYVTTPSIFSIIIYEIIILFPVLFMNIKENRKRKYKKLGIKIKNILIKNKKAIICLIILIVIIYAMLLSLFMQFTICFIDVGQGDSTLIITKSNKKILVDTGGSKDKSSFDVGEDTLVPYLLDKKIKTLDFVFISHFDSDHCNGLVAVLNKLKVKKVVLVKQQKICAEYENIIKIIKKQKIETVEVKNGDKVIIDKDTYFEILHPQKELIQENRTK